VSVQGGIEGARSVAAVRRCVVEANHDIGIFVGAADAVIEHTVVRDTLPRPDRTVGRGLGIVSHDATGEPSNVAVRASTIERVHDLGIMILGSDVSLQSTIVRDVRPRQVDGTRGRALQIQHEVVFDVPARASLRDSLVEQVHDFGLCVVAEHVEVSNTIVRATQPRQSDGLYGDGIALATGVGADVVRAHVERSLIEHNARAGLSMFGAFAALGSATLRCNAIDLTGADNPVSAVALEDLGANQCGCEAMAECRLVRSGLEPPEPLTQ
jgi:hypothetical protein